MNTDDSGAPLSVSEQQARILALRGFSQARSGDLDGARMTFARAAQTDEQLDLRRLPLFWTLPRIAHEVVAEALYDANRNQDAAALIADLRTRYRPRLVE